MLAKMFVCVGGWGVGGRLSCNTLCIPLCVEKKTHTHTYTHARTHARARAHTHTHARARKMSNYISETGFY